MNTDFTRPAQVTAVISTHNRCDDLRETLSRLLAMEETTLKIIVVDNASTDETRAMVRREFPDVLLMPHSANRAMEGYNAGFKRARSEYILILDDDSCPAPGTLRNMYDFLETHPEAGATAANIIDLDGSSEWAPRDHIAFSTQWDNLIGCGLLIRRPVLMAAKGYRTDFELYYNDLALALNILAQGYRIAFSRDWIVEHRRSPENRIHARKIHMMLRNFPWIIRSHFKGLKKFDLLLGHTCMMIRNAAQSQCLFSGFPFLFEGLFARKKYTFMPLPKSPARKRFCAEYAFSSNLLRRICGNRNIPEVPEENPDAIASDAHPPLSPVFPKPPKKKKHEPACYWQHRIGGGDVKAMHDDAAIRERKNADNHVNCDCGELMSWYRSPWDNYQRWIMRYSYISCTHRRALRKASKKWIWQPLISIITPTYKSNLDHFEELLRSIDKQIYTNWQFCVLDDGSGDQAPREAVERFAAQHPGKVKFRFNPENKGIGATEQELLEMADGEFVALLDHDDRLMPEALFQVVGQLRQDPDIDWFYSDMDKISPDGERFMHFFKPDWSPEYLRCCNYVLHLSVIRRSLMLEAGGFSSDCDGAQDYDLYLRLAEKSPRVFHIPRVLYSFRMSATSTAADLNAKPEIYEAGRKKLAEAYTRRGYNGHPETNDAAWAGHYKLVSDAPPPAIKTITFTADSPPEAETLNTIVKDQQYDVLCIRHDDLSLSEPALQELTAQVMLPGAGAISPKIISGDTVDHCGIAIGIGGELLYILRGHAEDDTGYGAIGAVTRNVAVPSPVCVLYNLKALQSIDGFSPGLSQGLFIDTAFALRENGFSVSVDGGIKATLPARWVAPECLKPKGHEFYELIKRRPTAMTAGDPYYNRNFGFLTDDDGDRYL